MIILRLTRLAKYTYGSNKGTTTKGTVINDPFKLGAVDPNFTAAIVAGEAKADATAAPAYSATLNWKPVVAGKVEVINATQTLRDFDGDGKLYIVVDGGKGDEAGTIDYATGALAITSAKVAAGKVAVNYAYDNVTIPGNDIPTINVEMATIPLVAKARRVQVYYKKCVA